eukprot:TRINITY_DN897_c0_g1_i6.p1 TRINITY_DN897_c0_g1~~TRINITY_DN897_c0_g1_i6.p1  ORF type:complete len:206 (+),score=37.30 TRINITY_DN897_c0_g1_i6:206-823(+)
MENIPEIYPAEVPIPSSGDSNKAEGSETNEGSGGSQEEAKLDGEKLQELERIRQLREEKERKVEAARLEAEKIQQQKEELERKVQETDLKAKQKRKASVEQERMAVQAAIEQAQIKQEEQLAAAVSEISEKSNNQEASPRLEGKVLTNEPGMHPTKTEEAKVDAVLDKSEGVLGQPMSAQPVLKRPYRNADDARERKCCCLTLCV